MEHRPPPVTGSVGRSAVARRRSRGQIAGVGGTLLRLLMLGALAAGGGCAGAFRCPAAGGTPWRQLASEHFLLATDLPADEAAEAVRDLEEYRALLIATAWPRRETPTPARSGSRDRGPQGGQVRVVIVARERDWRAFEEGRDGFYTEALFQPFIALRAGGSDHTRMRIRHELTHHLSRFFVREQPDWLAEGLATFFETLAYDRGTGEVLIGLPQSSHLNLLASRPGPLKIRETLAGTLKDDDSQLFYATSWLLVHYLISRQRTAFAGYMRALDAGLPAPEAWRRSFGDDLSPEALQAELSGYARAGHHMMISRAFQAPVVTTDERPLPDADVHALRALVYLRSGGDQVPPAARALARAEIAEALRQDPHDVLAHGARAFTLDQPIDLATARALTERHPDDWLAWAVLYRSSGGDFLSPETRRAAVTASRLAEANPSVKLPFGPARPLFTAGEPELHACTRDPTAAEVARARADRRRITPERDPCPAGRPLSSEEALAELRAIVTSDVSWCFFDQERWRPLTVGIEIDERGHPGAVCPEDPPADPALLACLRRALAALSFPARPDCPRLRLFQLAPATDGRVQVFGSAR